MRDRSEYAGRPLLRFLECYVLRTIGHLEPADEARLVRMTPRLREILGGDGTWDEILGRALQFPPNMSELVVALWQKHSTLARENGQVLAEAESTEP